MAMANSGKATEVPYRSPAVRQKVTNFFAGKRVALVGPAKSFEGAKFGKEIDAHDIVCRINVPEFSSAYYADFGSRTDVLFSNLNDYTVLVLSKIVDKWKAVKWVVQTQVGSEALREPKAFIAANVHNVPLYQPDPSGYQDLFRRVRAPPLSGVWVMDFLLKTRARSITLYGVDFYLTGWSSGRMRTRIEHTQNAKLTEGDFEKFGKGVSDIPYHNLAVQKAYFVDHILPEPRVRWVLPKSLQAMLLKPDPIDDPRPMSESTPSRQEESQTPAQSAPENPAAQAPAASGAPSAEPR